MNKLKYVLTDGRDDAKMHIIISFKPIHFKLFPTLLVIKANCINGSKNRIKTKDAALVHIRQSSKCDDTLCKMASSLLLQQQTGEVDSLNEMKRGRRVEAVDTTKTIVVRANAHIERNRKGDRLIECTEVICIQDAGDAPYLPVNYDDEENYEYITGKKDENPISLKIQRSKIFADWIVQTYGKELLSQRTGVLDVAGGNGETCRHLTAHEIPVTMLDPNPRTSGDHAYTVIPQPLNYDGSDLTSRNDEIGNLIRNCSFICGLHPDQATEPIVSLALRLDVPFAILPCCVMPSLFPHRVQKKHCDPVRSYSAFCQYLLDMAPEGEEFYEFYLPFVGRNKVIFRLPRKASRNKTTTSKSAK